MNCENCGENLEGKAQYDLGEIVVGDCCIDEVSEAEKDHRQDI